MVIERPPGHPRRLRLAALAAGGLVLLAGCGQSDDETDPPADEGSETEEPDEPAEDAEPSPESSEDPDDDTGDDVEETEEPDEPEEPVDDPDLDVELTLTPVVSMNAPVAGAVGPDGVLHLAERAGTIHPLEGDELGDAVVDISDETTVDAERGLLGFVFSEDGSELYVSYTDRSGDSVIEAFAVEDGEVVQDERRTLLTLEQPYANHNGGDVHIGPDGYLHIGFGDGGGGGDPTGAGQDLSTLLGSLVRIDPDGDPYAVPGDNPFVDDDEAADEILVYGLRNPWRFSFDRRTGDLWIADVGQDSREEINRLPDGEIAGANLGWSLMEGTLEIGEPPEDHVPPVHEYETGERCAVTGGYVYRGEAIPELAGAYLYSDFCDGTIRGLVVDEDGEVVEETDLGIAGQAVVSFAQDADGELYVLDFGGQVSRIDPA